MKKKEDYLKERFEDEKRDREEEDAEAWWKLQEKEESVLERRVDRRESL